MSEIFVPKIVTIGSLFFKL